MICNKCGQTLPDDSTFCQFCGSKIEIIAVSTDETPSVSKEEVLAKVLATGVVEGQKAMEANKESQPHNELDADFGLVPQKPVYTVGIDEQEKYLKSLRTINGEPIKWNRRGSMSVDGVNGMVDVYDTYLPTGEEYKTIYINMYGAYNSSFAPKGFSILMVPVSCATNKAKKQRKQKKWLVAAMLSIAFVIVGAIVFTVLGIQSNKYNQACEKMDLGLYEEAIEIFEELGTYKNADKKINEAKYGYVQKYKNNDNKTTFAYLKDLKKADYRDSVNIFKNLYEWKITVIAVNSSETDDFTYRSAISKYDPVYFHLKLSGGEPGESVRITVNPTYPDGEVGEYIFEEKWSDGDVLWYGWDAGIYEYPEYGDTGTLRCNFYDESGNLIGGGSVKITDSFSEANTSGYIECTVEQLYKNPQQYNGKKVKVTSWKVICDYETGTTIGTFYDFLLCDDLTHYQDKTSYPIVPVYKYYTDCIQPFSTPYLGARVFDANIYTDISKEKSKITIYGTFTYNPNVSEGGYIHEPHVYNVDVDAYIEQ